MKATLFMAISANGYAARPDGSEDFLSDDNWLEFIKIARTYGHVIWGKKTHETVLSWGEPYTSSLEGIEIISISKETGVTPEAALKLVEQLGFKKPLLAGGPTVNASFISKNLVDEVIFNYNSIIIGQGKPVINEGLFDLKLQIKEIKQLTAEILQIHMKAA